VEEGTDDSRAAGAWKIMMGGPHRTGSSHGESSRPSESGSEERSSKRGKIYGTRMARPQSAAGPRGNMESRPASRPQSADPARMSKENLNYLAAMHGLDRSRTRTRDFRVDGGNDEDDNDDDDSDEARPIQAGRSRSSSKNSKSALTLNPLTRSSKGQQHPQEAGISPTKMPLRSSIRLEPASTTRMRRPASDISIAKQWAPLGAGKQLAGDLVDRPEGSLTISGLIFLLGGDENHAFDDPWALNSQSAARALHQHLAANGRWKECRKSAFSMGMIWQVLCDGGCEQLIDSLDLVLAVCSRCPGESEVHRPYLESIRRFIIAFKDKIARLDGFAGLIELASSKSEHGEEMVLEAGKAYVSAVHACISRAEASITAGTDARLIEALGSLSRRGGGEALSRCNPTATIALCEEASHGFSNVALFFNPGPGGRGSWPPSRQVLRC
jgi:hypothetical protein